MDYRRVFALGPDRYREKPGTRGLRIDVSNVLAYVASGASHEEIATDFPGLTHDDIDACVALAAERERRLVVSPEGDSLGRPRRRRGPIPAFAGLEFQTTPREPSESNDSRSSMGKWHKNTI